MEYKNYKLVSETEDGGSFVNEDTKFCAILLKNYKREGAQNNERGIDLHESLTKKYVFAQKSTICIIITSEEEDKEKVLRDEYFFVKVFVDKIDILPSKIDKSIVITFSPMIDSQDLGNYTINPFDYFDGKCSVEFFYYIANNAKNGDIVKYPKIVETSFFRYHSNKLYTIENIK